MAHRRVGQAQRDAGSVGIGVDPATGRKGDVALARCIRRGGIVVDEAGVGLSRS